MTDRNYKQCLFFAASRTRRKARILTLVMVFVMLMSAGIFRADICYAGEMNGAESSIYGAASGTFEYDGKLYRAYDEYLGQLAGYLCRDDVDLDDATASAAISKMYANVGVGVAQGYLYQVGQVKEDAEEYFRENEPSEDPMENEEEYLNSKLYLENMEKIDKNSSVLIEDNKRARAERENNLKQAKAVFQETLSKRKAFESNDAEPDGESAHDHSSDKPASDNHNQSIDLSGIGIFGFSHTAVIAAAIVSSILILIAAIVLLINRCYVFQKKKKHSNHHKRKYIRKYFAAVLILVTAINGTVVLGGLGYIIGLGSYDSVKTSMDNSGIYHIHYEELMEVIQEKLEEYNLNPRLCDQIVTYSDFQFDCEKALKSQLKGKSPKATHSGVEEKIVGQMETVAYLQEKDAKDFGQAIIQIYREKANSPIGSAVYQARQKTARDFRAGFILCSVNMVLAFVLLLLGQRRIKQGFGKAFAGALAVCAVFGVIVAFASLTKSYEQLAIADDELYVFAVNWAEYGIRAMGQVLGAGCIGAVLLGIAARFMR